MGIFGADGGPLYTLQVTTRTVLLLLGWLVVDRLQMEEMEIVDGDISFCSIAGGDALLLALGKAYHLSFSPGGDRRLRLQAIPMPAVRRVGTVEPHDVTDYVTAGALHCSYSEFFLPQQAAHDDAHGGMEVRSFHSQPSVVTVTAAEQEDYLLYGDNDAVKPMAATPSTTTDASLVSSVSVVVLCGRSGYLHILRLADQAVLFSARQFALAPLLLVDSEGPSGAVAESEAPEIEIVEVLLTVMYEGGPPTLLSISKAGMLTIYTGFLYLAATAPRHLRFQKIDHGYLLHDPLS